MQEISPCGNANGQLPGANIVIWTVEANGELRFERCGQCDLERPNYTDWSTALEKVLLGNYWTCTLHHGDLFHLAYTDKKFKELVMGLTGPVAMYHDMRAKGHRMRCKHSVQIQTA